jgi:hypothetical protein
MSKEQDKGSPPPRMSSREGIPDEVSNVNADDGQDLVPAGGLDCFEVVFRLKEDMKPVGTTISCMNGIPQPCLDCPDTTARMECSPRIWIKATVI